MPAASPAFAMADGLIVTLRTLDPAAAWIDAWRDLGGRALLDNLFYDADFALAAAGAFGEGVEVALVGDRLPEEPGLRLVAVWPFRRTRTRWGVPLTLALGWMHGFGVFGVPLLDAEEPRRALGALMLGLRGLGLRRLMLTHVPTEGPFAGHLAAWSASEGTRRAPFWEHARACLDLGAARGQTLDHLSGRRRRRLRQARESLEAEGRLQVETLSALQDVESALTDYLALESRGWKGRAGSAIADSTGEIALMRASVAAYGRSGSVRIDRLRRNERTLASAVSFVTRGRLWCLKISYDEDSARDSPGALLLHAMTLSLMAEPGLVSADSCAPPGFRLAETFWPGRLALAHVLVETGPGDRLFPLAVRLERLRAWASRTAQRQSRAPQDDG